MALYDYERQQYQQPRKPVSNDELFRQMQTQAFDNQNTSQPVEESSGLRRFVGDPLVSLGRGVIGAGEGFVGLANIPTAGYAGKALTDLTGYDPAEAKRSLATLYTPEQQQAFQEVEAAERFLPTLKSMVKRPSTIAHNVIESVPSMVGGSLIGRKALQYAPGIATALGSRAGMLAGASGEGAMTAGQIAETARQQSDDGLINFKQAGQAVAGGIGTGALGVVGNALGGKLANKLGVDITDIDTALVTGKLASSGNIGKRLIAGGISEGVFEELPQSVQEQLWTNAATGRDLYEGVQESAATGLLTGAAMGAGANVFSGQNVDDTKKEEAKPPREQLLNVDKQIFDLEQNTQTPESQQTLNTLYGQRDELLKNIRGITNTPVTKYEQPLSDDIDTISRQITNLEASGRDTIGTRELLQDLYGQKEILAKQIEDAPWIETEREIERQQRVRDYQNKIKVIESDETLSEEDKTNQINLLTQQYQKDYKPRDFASEARKTMQKSVEKLTTGTFIPADQNELDMAMDDLMAQYEELAKEEEDIKKSEEIINNQKRVLGLSKQVDSLKEIQPLKDRAKVENIFNTLMIKENQTGLTDQEKKTLTTAKAKLTKDNNRIEKIAKLNQEMSQLFTDTDETLMGRFQRDFDIQRQESQEQQEYKNTLYDNAINFVTSQNKISPRGLMGHFDLTYPEAQELLKNMEAEGIVGQAGKANIRNVNKVSEVRSNIEQPLVNQITEQEQSGLEDQPIQPVQPDMQGQQIVQDVPEMSNEKSTFTDEQPVEQIVNQQQEQPVEQTINTEQPQITKPIKSVEDFQTIEDPLIAVQEDIQARQDNISALKEELEANKLEQSRMDINDPMLEELKLDEQAINEQIKEANRELLITRLTEGKGKFQITYHGTPHQWQPELGFPNGRPRLDKIGTGEGAAAFGHGWYSAEVSETAESYKTSNESNLISRIANISDVYGNPTKGNEKSHAELTKQLENLPDSGALYKLDIPDETIPKLLEWDKPISEQSEYVKSALKKLVSDKDFISSLRQDRGSRPDFITGVMGISDEQFQNKYIAKGYSFKNGDMYNRKGEKLPKTAVEQQRMLDEGSQVYRDMGHMYRDLAHMLGSDVAASNALLNVGIPGNKYFDGMSRADGKGSYNYVIWDQNVLDKIALLERNGEKIKAIQKQYETRNKQEPTKGISLSDIKKNFKTEEVSQDENGIISVKFKNGKGITFNSVQDAGNGFIQFAINTGQLSKNGKILGVTTGSNVLLDKDFADNKTVWHETFHVFKNLNMINDAEYSHLVKDFNKLRKAGKLQFSLSTHEDPMAALEENLANSFAQVMTSREDYRNTALGKMIQRIMDFMKKMFSFGQQSLSGFAKEVETGKIYDREISDLETGTATSNFQSIGNTNSEEFKTWFGKSAAKTKAGEPVVFYHGTPNNFTIFENRPGQSTLHATSGLGHFFTMDKNYAEAYSKETGNVMPVYLKMEKPYKMSLEEAQSYETILDAKVAQRLLKRKGYDSVIISVPGSQPMITIFNSNQIKSINNQGTWDINNPDIRFEVREKLGIPEQDIPQAEYDKMRQENRDLIGKTKQFLRSKGHEVNREMNKYLGVTSTNLAKIHPMLRAKVRRLDFDTLQRIHANLNIALPVLEAVKKMSSNERSDFDWAVKNGDSGKILSLTGKYNFTEKYNALRAMLDQTHGDLKDVGYKPGFVDTYWPRLMKDREGFLQATREISRDPVFTQALQDKASKLGKTIEQLDPDVRADIIAQKIMEIKSGMGGPANIQGRIFDKIPIDLGKYYMDSSAALVQYIYSTAKNIEARKFFGKVPTKISNAKSIVRQNNDKLNKLQNTAGLLASQDRDTTDIDLQIKEVKDNIKLHEKVIEEYGQTRDFTDNIGSYIDEIRASQLIPEKKFQENEGILKDILSARFHERGTSGIANIYKNVSLLDTMGSPLSAFTQIQDLGWSIYVGGLTPRGITNTVKNIGKAIANRSDITKEDLGLEWIAQEFADADTLSSAVNKTFKLIGLNYVDSIGKESLINNAYDNYRVKAKDKPKLFKEIRHMFNSDKETNQVIEDLQNNVRDSKDVQFLTFSRLLDFQPVAKSEMPEKMLTAGNWRLAYLLKTFTIKQFDVFRNEVWHKLKSGDKGQVIEGLRNMAYLTSIMTLSGAGADELKDFILGKETRFEDHVIENFLTLGGANRYIRMQVNREGIGTALGKQVLPPFKFIDNIYKDISQDVTDLHSARFIDSIPVVGKLYYWHLGRGAENKESIAEQDFKKLGKDVREFKKRLENNTDKRSFVQANMSEYRQMKRHENVQGNLNKYTSLINKLKKVPQTENVKRRINQLEERKEQIMTRYFM